MTNFLPSLPPAILERCLAFSEQLYVIKPTVSTLSTTPKQEDCPKKDEPKEDSDKDILSESTLMDTSPCDVVLQRLSPMNKARKSSSKIEIANTPKIPPVISPLKSPNKETEGTKDEIIHLSFCATNESEAVKHNGFPNSQFLLVSNKNPNNFFYSSKVKSSNIPQIIKVMNYRENGPVQLRIVSTKKTFSPEIPNHCQDCQVLCRQK